MIDLHKKDWINHLIVAMGLIVAALLLIGLFITLRTVSGKKSVSTTPTTHSVVRCRKNCITSADSHTQKTFTLGDTFTLELPQSQFPQDNLTVLENPEGTLKKIENPKVAQQQSNSWMATFQVVKKGIADIVVKNTADNASDFQLSLTIE